MKIDKAAAIWHDYRVWICSMAINLISFDIALQLYPLIKQKCFTMTIYISQLQGIFWQIVNNVIYISYKAYKNNIYFLWYEQVLSS